MSELLLWASRKFELIAQVGVCVPDHKSQFHLTWMKYQMSNALNTLNENLATNQVVATTTKKK